MKTKIKQVWDKYKMNIFMFILGVNTGLLYSILIATINNS